MQVLLDPVYIDPAPPHLRAEWERAGKCSTCGRDDPAATIFDQESRKEFEITGMCQRCQNETYKSEESSRAYLRAEAERPEYAERKRRRLEAK